MFVVTESIGGIVARIAREAGIRPQELVVTEDRVVVTFGAGNAVKGRKSASPCALPDNFRRISAETEGKLPVGPWKKHGRKGNATVWSCEGRKATLDEIAAAFGVARTCMEHRLRTGGGMALTARKRSKFERRTRTADAMALATTSKEAN